MTTETTTSHTRRRFLMGSAMIGAGATVFGGGLALSRNPGAKGSKEIQYWPVETRPAAVAGVAVQQAPAPSRDPVARIYNPILPPVYVPGSTFDLVSKDVPVEVNKDTMMNAWTFGDAVPGPVINATQGDTLKLRLTNQGTIPHSADLHAAFTPMHKGYMESIAPGASLDMDLPVPYPGAFMYHCGTPPVFHHIANGMYGAVIVQPKAGWPAKADHEWVLVNSELYLETDTADTYTTSVDRMLSVQPDYVVWNGAAFQYLNAPLEAKAGELLRVYVVNSGPTLTSAFHVIGTLFETLYVDGNPANALKGIQTWNVPPGGGAVFELRIPEAGDYPFVTHSFAYTELGAIGVIRIT